MFTRIIYPIGIIASLMLIVSCFLPWTYYNDPQIQSESERIFTGFYSFKNSYGRPGMFLVPLTAIILLFQLLPHVWAKRINLFAAALLLGFTIKTYVLFTSCYNFYCPEKKPAIFLVFISAILILISAIFPWGKKGMPKPKNR